MKNPFQSSWGQEFFQNHKKKILVAQALLFAAVGYVVAGGFSTPPATESAMEHQHASESKAASGPSLWTCSMHPQ
ncbi:MAG: hypothetical protein KDA84_23995, partial [Planctomycetaceae bacterium]|nr:hypothetical protein [Planctomycetaceae bacterium]